MPMSGPIVRTGTTPEFWKNWDKAFSGKSKPGKASSAGKKTAKKAAKKSKKKSASAKSSPKKKAKAAAKKK